MSPGSICILVSLRSAGYGKWQACRISPFVVNLSTRNKNTCHQRKSIISNHTKDLLLFLYFHIPSEFIFLYCNLICHLYRYTRNYIFQTYIRSRIYETIIKRCRLYFCFWLNVNHNTQKITFTKLENKISSYTYIYIITHISNFDRANSNAQSISYPLSLCYLFSQRLRAALSHAVIHYKCWYKSLLSVEIPELLHILQL